MSPNAFSIPLTAVVLFLGTQLSADDLDAARRILKEAETNLRDCGQNSSSTAELWADLGKAEARCGARGKATETLRAAWKMALSIPDDSRRHEILRAVARGQIQCGHIQELLQHVDRLPLLEDQSYVLIWSVQALGLRGDMDGAIRVAGLISTTDVSARADALRFAGFSALNKNDFQAALKVCELLQAPASASGNRGETDHHRDGGSNTIRSRDLVLGYLARGLARAGKFDDALQTMNRVTTKDDREFVFRDIVKLAGDAGRLEIATSLLQKATSADQKNVVLAALAAVRAKLGRTEEAFQTVDQIGFPPMQCDALLRMGVVFAKQGAEERFWRAHDAALRLERKEDLRMLQDGDRQFIRAFLQANCLGPAISIADQIKDPDLGSRVWQAIGMAAAKTNNRDDAKMAFHQSRVAADRVEVMEFRLGRLSEMAAAQSQSGDRPGASLVFRDLLKELRLLLAADSPDVEEALAIAATAAVFGDRQRAIDVLPLIADALDRCSDAKDRERYLEESGRTYAKIGELNAGIRLARRQKLPIDRVRLFLGLAKGLVANSANEPPVSVADPIRGEPE